MYGSAWRRVQGAALYMVRTVFVGAPFGRPLAAKGRPYKKH